MRGSRRNLLIITWVVMLAICLYASPVPVNAGMPEDGQSSLERAVGYYSHQSSYDDWEALGLRWAGQTAGSKYLPMENPAAASDYARSILGGISAELEQDEVKGLISSLQALQQGNGSFSTEDNPSLNQTIWAIIALDFAAKNGFPVTYDRSKAIDCILAGQDASGGFDESGWGVDVDSTAHALMALAADRNQDKCKGAIASALAYLKSQQSAAGLFASWGTGSPDSTAAVVEALVALQIDPTQPGEGWQGNMVQALLNFQLDNGGFASPWDPDKPNNMTTRNALLALGDVVKGKSKYQHPLEEGADQALSASFSGVDALRLDSDVNAMVRLENRLDSSYDVLLIAALFDLQQEKMTAYTYTSRQIAPREVLEVGWGMSLPAAGPYELRFWVWDNWEKRTPLMSPTVFPVR